MPDPKAHYKNLLKGVKWFPHADKSSSLRRLLGIFQTSFFQRFEERPFFQIPAAESDMMPVYTLLSPLLASDYSWPQHAHDFDQWQKALCKKVALAYAATAPHPLGIAQKTVNLFFKDMWAWGRLDSHLTSDLHAVVDAEVVKRLVKLPPKRPKDYPFGWRTWSFVRYSTDAQFDAAWADYMSVQKELAERATKQGIARVELEQRLWAGDR